MSSLIDIALAPTETNDIAINKIVKYVRLICFTIISINYLKLTPKFNQFRNTSQPSDATVVTIQKKFLIEIFVFTLFLSLIDLLLNYEIFVTVFLQFSKDSCGEAENLFFNEKFKQLE